MEAPPVPSLSTGFSSLDSALGGGLPRGRIAELFGPPSCGKTEVALRAVAGAQQSGLSAAWIDADRTFEPGATGTGAGLIVARPDSAEEALEIACRLADCSAVDLLVIDSAAALVPRLELQTAIGESGPSLQARVFAAGLRKLALAARRGGCAVLIVNQTRGKREMAGEESESSAGGPALKMHAAVRIGLQLEASGETRFRILKNRVAAPFASGILT
jgi:recombination protein RecA